jgi:hypothetical protein
MGLRGLSSSAPLGSTRLGNAGRMHGLLFWGSIYQCRPQEWIVFAESLSFFSFRLGGYLSISYLAFTIGQLLEPICRQ